MPVFKLPVVRNPSELQPTAVLYVPVVRWRRALCPSAVFCRGYPPSGAGTTACAAGESAKQTSVNAMNNLKFFMVNPCLE